ncbi:MAG: glycosyltransferase [Nitrospirae bacterium]|nr:glycosyltransferase [Nitrospirota bacterium]
METERNISVIIPNYNDAENLGKCLEAVFSSNYKHFEVIVVDDCSNDNSLEVAGKYPCKLIPLKKHSGAGAARNTGAKESSGSILFFTDADCLLNKNTLSIINRTFPDETKSGTVIGGTYTIMSYDRNFFSIFQSVFINYSETKKPESPDYIAAHAMIMDADTFRKSGGFPEKFLPIIEDVEFSHRLRRMGCRLKMEPEIQVRHIFNFALMKSLKNAVRKSCYWTMYSLKNKDMFADSGTASLELKMNAVLFFLTLCLLISGLFSGKAVFLYILPMPILMNSFISRGLLRAFYKTKGGFFAGAAFLYYILLYPVAVIYGAGAGMVRYLFKREGQNSVFGVRS